MAWIELSDGWRDESSDGPYTETLQTKYIWETGDTYEIARCRGETKFSLSCCQRKLGDFATISDAKSAVNAILGN